jgi:microcystin-dependent protein
MAIEAQVDGNLLLTVHNLNATALTGVTSPNTGSLAFNTSTNLFTNYDGTKWTQAVTEAYIGDIQTGFSNSDQDGWYVLDGRRINSLPANARSAASSLGFRGRLPNAQDAVLKQSNGSQNLGTTGGNDQITLTQANLPNVNFSGSTSAIGNHNHNVSGNFSDERIRNNVDAYRNLLLAGGSSTSSTDGNHNHSFTVNSGGSSTTLTQYQPYFVVNTLIYLGE